MGTIDAKQKFSEAVNTYKVADEKAKSGGLNKIDARTFKMVIIDLDAAIPGLTGIMLGRALLLKACCLYWLHLDKLTKHQSILSVVEAPPDPLLKEGLSCAMRGRKILEEHGSKVDLPWANDTVNKLRGH